MLNGFITTNRFARTLNIPLSFAQTELRSGKAIVIAEIPLELHQRLELRSLTLAVFAILTPGVIPFYLNTAMGLCSVGLYRTPMLSSPLAYAIFTDQNCTSNPFSPCVVETPGLYRVVVSNNTNNTDLSVTVTGSAKIYV